MSCGNKGGKMSKRLKNLWCWYWGLVVDGVDRTYFALAPRSRGRAMASEKFPFFIVQKNLFFFPLPFLSIECRGYSRYKWHSLCIMRTILLLLLINWFWIDSEMAQWEIMEILNWFRHGSVGNYGNSDNKNWCWNDNKIVFGIDTVSSMTVYIDSSVVVMFGV